MEADNLFTQTLHEWLGLFMRRSMADLVLHARASGLSMSQMGTLFHIHRKGVCSVSDIGDDLGTTRAAASQMLQRLVEQGLIARSEDSRDRRAKRVSLTDQGQRMVQESIQARLGWLDDLAPLLSAEEQEQITAALRVLIERASRVGADRR